MTSVKKLSTNIYTVKTAKASALVTFGNVDSAYSSGKTGGSAKSGDHVLWGPKDAQLADMHRLACESPNKWQLVKTRRNFVVGRGVYTHSEEEAAVGSPTYFKRVIFPDFELWRKLYNWDRTWMKLGLHYGFSGNVFVKLTFELGGKLGPIDSIDAFKIRPSVLLDGEEQTSSYIVNHNHFGSKDWKKKDNVVIPAFDPADPAKYPVSILHLKDDLPGQDNFGFAEWWSTADWAKVANKIPIFHDSGLDNGYNLKYHISIPDDYFQKDDLDEAEQEKLKEETVRQMGESLSGIENTDKAIITFHKTDGTGKEITGIKITPLDNKMSDDAYTALFTTANIAQASGHGVLPSLAGIDTGGKLGGSGKELESAANYQQLFLTYVDRFILLTPLRIAAAVNGWDPAIQFDVRNIQMYNYDVTPTTADTNPNSQDANVA